MMKRNFCKLMLGAAFAVAFGGAAMADDALAKVKAAGVLKVGTETEFAPFDFIDAGAHVGLNVDLFDEIGKELGVKIEWVTLPWDGVLPGLEAGKFEYVAGPATITKARSEHYRFSPNALVCASCEVALASPMVLPPMSSGLVIEESPLRFISATVASAIGSEKR